MDKRGSSAPDGSLSLSLSPSLSLWSTSPPSAHVSPAIGSSHHHTAFGCILLAKRGGGERVLAHEANQSPQNSARRFPPPTAAALSTE